MTLKNKGKRNLMNTQNNIFVYYIFILYTIGETIFNAYHCDASNKILKINFYFTN